MSRIVVPRGDHGERLNGVFIGIVKDNTDINRMGRLRVFIKELGGLEDDPESWKTVEYASPFAGTTPLIGPGSPPAGGSLSFNQTQKSYGMWFPNPDLGNRVLVMFINGLPQSGFWFACLWQQNMNHMVPGIPGNPSPKPSDNSTTYYPSVEYNVKDTSINPFQPFRSAHTPLLDGLSKQGLDEDYVRGITTSGARRQTKSTVYGFLTPRGTQIVFDDGYLDEEIDAGLTNAGAATLGNPSDQDGPSGRKDEFIRLRTRSGAQIMVNETFGMVYLISRDGNNWVEMSNDGHIDVFAEDDISLHTSKSINLRADEDINIEAGRNINVRALGQAVKEESKGTGNIYMVSGSDIPTLPANISDDSGLSVNSIHLKSHGNAYTSVDHDYHIMVGDTAVSNADGDETEPVAGASGTSGNFVLQTTSKLDFQIGTQAHIQTGSLFHLFTGGPQAFDSNASGSFERIDFNSGIATSASSAILANSPKIYKLDDIDGNTTLLRSIVERAPEHEPWLGHTSRSDIITAPTVKADSVPLAKTVQDIDRQTTGSPIQRTNTQTTVRKPTTVGSNFTSGAQPQGTTITTVTNDIKSSNVTSSVKEPINSVSISDPGIISLLNFEHYWPYEYFDIKGFSIGYGHLQADGPEERFDNGLTEEEAYRVFRQDLTKFERSIRGSINVPVSQQQFDALMIFVYNLGSVRPSLREAINSGNEEKIANAWMLYVYGDGKVMSGLVNRRRQELLLWRTGAYPAGRSRAEHREAGLQNVARRWRQKDLEPHVGRKTTQRQIVQAFTAYQEETGKALPSNVAGIPPSIRGFA